MDLSPEFIKMCEKAEEIQKTSLTYGDYYWWRNHLCLHFENAFAISQDSFIWLPRQDQLQEMIKAGDILLSWGEFWHFMEEPYGRVDGFPPGVFKCLALRPTALFETWEQLWLAFVMKEKYGKTWNGEDWASKPLSPSS